MTINCKGQLIDLSSPKVMGILNLTPDSFYDGGQFKSESEILNKVERMLSDGATFIDVGAYSSRPGADFVSEKDELNRLLPVVKILIKTFPEIIISIDTFRSVVAKLAISEGAALINDISAGRLDEDMLQTIANIRVPYIMMHMRGTSKTMQSLTDYNNLITEILFYFSKHIAEAKSLGIVDLICDPGFGFAKTTNQNFELLYHLDLFKQLEFPILAGISRKSMIYKTLNNSPKEALNGTTALHMIALEKGASILRVHDVKEAMECVTLHNALRNELVYS